MKRVLVIGSNGWLASRIVSMLKEREGKTVFVRGFDIMNSKPDIPVDDFVKGDIVSKANVLSAMEGIDTVFHVAAVVLGPAHILQRVNVSGVQNSLACAVEAGVKRFIYTSSASVVYNGVNLSDATEDLPYTSELDLDPYTTTKAKAEGLVLAANGKGGLFTCALRPHSIYGPGDPISWPSMLANAKAGKLKWKLVDDTYKSSYTFVDNIVHAELIAAAKLTTPEGQKIVGGQAYNISDGQDGLFWSNLYDVAELSGVPRTEYGKFTLTPIFPVIYLFAWIFWKLGYPLGTFTPYVLALASTTHTYSIKKAQEQLGYAPLMSHKESWALTKQSFKNWKNTYKAPPKSRKGWVILVGFALLAIYWFFF